METVDKIHEIDAVDNELPLKEPLKPAQRLCSEIQLFDLCNLESCSFKDGKFCADPFILEKFEALINEEEVEILRFTDDFSEEEDEERDIGDFYDYEPEDESDWQEES